MTSTETKLISINAALAERAERLRAEEHAIDSCDAPTPGQATASYLTRKAIKAQIRDLETEKHALIQEMPL
jgi:hypothetical protein